MKRIIYAIVIGILGAQCGLAAAAEPAGKPHELQPITVQGDLLNEPANSTYHLPESTLATTWSIDQEQIQALEPRDVFDVLSYAPGVQTAFMGRKAMNFISSRGGGNFVGGSSFAVLIDGAYIPWTQSARVLAAFPVENIASIKVVRNSSVFSLAPLSAPGSIGTAIQGVVIIKTRKPDKQQTEIKGRYGNLGRYKAYAGHGDKLYQGYYSLSYAHQNDDGRDGWNNASQSDTFLGRGGYDHLGLKADGTFYYSGGSRDIQRGLAISKTYDNKWEYDPLNTMIAAGNLSKQWSPAQTTALGVYTGRVDTTVRYRSWTKPAYTYNDQEDNVFQADLHHIVTTSRHNLRMGVQALFWDCPQGQLFYEGVERDEQLYSAYLHDEYALSEALKLDLGGRVDQKHVSKGINKYMSTDNTPTVLINDKWAEPSYGVGAGGSYAFNAIWEASLRASFTQQGADEFLVSADNQPLASEKQMRYEAGLIARLHPAVRASVTGYYYDLKDMKQYAGSVRQGRDLINTYVNADAKRTGVELDVSGYLFTPRLTYGLSYTYQTSDNEIDDKSIPNQIVALRLGYRYAPFQVNLTLRHVSAYDSNLFAADNLYHEVGDYSPIDANVSYDFKMGRGQWRATAFAQNLGDEKYQTRLGWEDVGLTYGLELGVKF
ncbi:MAG: TonB-dependent receptor plug domain-containing protein [Pseudomonadota bacterium]